MLKSHIVNTTNTKKHAAVVKEKPKNLALELECTARDGCAL